MKAIACKFEVKSCNDIRVPHSYSKSDHDPSNFVDIAGFSEILAFRRKFSDVCYIYIYIYIYIFFQNF